MIRAYRGIVPKIAASSYIDPSAQVIGDVEVGERSSVWCNVTIRGDVNYIRIGEETSIQDNSVIHVEHDVARVQDENYKAPASHGGPETGIRPVIGNRVTVGHSVTLHGCTIEDECLIGIGAIVLNGARVGKGSVIAAGALVPERMQVPPGSLVMGVPGKVKRETTPEEQQRFRDNAQNYVKYRADLSGRALLIRAVKGTRDILPPVVRRLEPRGSGRAPHFPRLQLPRNPHPDLRGDQLFARGVGEETDIVTQGDVHVRRSRRDLADAASREHGVGDPRLYRAPARPAPGRAEALLHGADVPPRAAAEGPLPAVLPDRRGGDRLGIARWWTPK